MQISSKVLEGILKEEKFKRFIDYSSTFNYIFKLEFGFKIYKNINCSELKYSHLLRGFEQSMGSGISSPYNSYTLIDVHFHRKEQPTFPSVSNNGRGDLRTLSIERTANRFDYNLDVKPISAICSSGDKGIYLLLVQENTDEPISFKTLNNLDKELCKSFNFISLLNRSGIMDLEDSNNFVSYQLENTGLYNSEAIILNKGYYQTNSKSIEARLKKFSYSEMERGPPKGVKRSSCFYRNAGSLISPKELTFIS